jgi:hypothetical protein
MILFEGVYAFQCYNITILQYYNITILQYYNITILQYCNIIIKTWKNKKNMDSWSKLGMSTSFILNHHFLAFNFWRI